MSNFLCGKDVSANCKEFASFDSFFHIKSKILSDRKEINVTNVRSATSFQ